MTAGHQGFDLTGTLRDSTLAALVTALLCVPIVVLHADRNLANQFVLEQRWWWMAIAAGVVFAARFLALLVRAMLQPRRKPEVLARPVRTVVRALGRFIGAAAIIGVFAYPIVIVVLLGPDASLKWINNYGIQILIYVMLGWGLNIVVGLAGLLDLGYVAFYAVGAYAYALLSTTAGLSFWACLPLAGIAAACFGLVLGFPVLRLRGDYLAIVTLAFGEIIYLVLINWTDFTNGDAGIQDIPAATFFGIPFTDSDDGFATVMRGLVGKWFPEYQPIQLNIFLFYLALLMALVTCFVTARLRRLPMGRAWEALREDEIACRSLGINTITTKLSAFALGAFFAGLAGAFFAVRQGYVNPSSFKFDESALILAIVVLGGMGSQAGVAIAAIVMIGGTELLRELDWIKQLFPDFDPTQYRMLIFGFGMVAMMIWRPRGLVSTRRPTVFLKQEKLIDSSLVAEGHG